jgi:hypothetical protein
MTVPIFLDFITVFCLVAGCLLLWFDLRSSARDVILTKADGIDPGVVASTDSENVSDQGVLSEMLRPGAVDRLAVD